ncbi:efflux RND transporter periplasmic adaptor subunit [Geoalkalibacter sp.]|uniref:efflux RND transporter periplasmic adaptor subunit n=1 Tax=Geoalkalibacter sp. TaxID=3041440 RepID=UPI00272E1E99|nr:HlyD family efflux transporter periplasmic adaptor subunit [Geoalkalibacter sp.]
MGLRRYVVYGLLVAGVALLLFLGFRPQPLLVDTEAVSRGPMARTIEEEGRTRVMHAYRVSAPLAGQVRRIALEPGDPVEAGQIVAVLDAQAAPVLDVRTIKAAEARVEAATAALEAARREGEAALAAALFAEAEHGRMRTLGEQRLVALNEVEAAAANAAAAQALRRAAEARVAGARHELAAARTALAFSGGQDPAASGVVALAAPVSGRVLRRFFESARVVAAGEPILDIGDPALLEVEVDVLSADAVRIAPGMKVLFERWGEAEPLEGRVRRVEPGGFTKVSALGVEEQRVLVIADFIAPAQRWARLGDAYRVNARFILWETQETLRVPLSALFRHGEGWALFVVEESRARLREVEVGERGGRFAEVREGVASGARVILHPDRQLEDGRRVRPRPGRDGIAAR